MSDLALKFTYKPEGVPPRVWAVDLMDDVRASELIAVQKVSGIRGLTDLWEGITVTDVVAVKALLWLLLKRDMSTLSWDSLDFTLSEVEIGDVDMTPGEEMVRLRRLAAQDALNDLGLKRLADLEFLGVEPELADPKA